MIRQSHLLPRHLLSKLFLIISCGVLLNEFIPGLSFPREHAHIWRFCLFIEGVLGVWVIWYAFRTKDRGSLIFVCFVLALGFFNVLTESLNEPEFSLRFFIPTLVTLSGYYFGVKREHDPVVIVVMVAIGLSAVAVLMDIEMFNKLKVVYDKQLDSQGYIVSASAYGNRWKGIFSSPNYLALSFLYVTVILPRIRQTFIRNSLCLAVFAGIVATGSRGSFLAAFCMFLWITYKRKHFVSINLIIFYILVGSLLISFFGILELIESVGLAKTSIVANSFLDVYFGRGFGDRWFILITAFRVLIENFWLGVGSTNYNLVTIYSSMGKIALGPHVWLLEIAIVNGVISMAMTIALIVLTFKIVLKKRLSEQPILVYYIGILIAIVLYSLFNGFLSAYMPWSVLGYVVGLASSAKNILLPNRSFVRGEYLGKTESYERTTR